MNLIRNIKMKQHVRALFKQGQPVDEIVDKVIHDYDLNSQETEQLMEMIERMNNPKNIESKKEDKILKKYQINEETYHQEIERLVDDTYDRFVDINELCGDNDWYDRDNCIDEVTNRLKDNAAIIEQNRAEYISNYAMENIEEQYEMVKEIGIRI